MKKSSLLSQLAIAGIAAGLVSAVPARAADAARDTAKVSAPAKKKHKKKKTAMMDSGSTKMDSSMTTHMGDKAAMMSGEKHGCKGQNSCKGLGGCKTSQTELESRAKKMGISMDKAGSAHSCKSKNDCKGLGGCKST